jgi:hypothetical protein
MKVIRVEEDGSEQIIELDPASVAMTADEIEELLVEGGERRQRTFTPKESFLCDDCGSTSTEGAMVTFETLQPDGSFKEPTPEQERLREKYERLGFEELDAYRHAGVSLIGLCSACVSKRL